MKGNRKTYGHKDVGRLELEGGWYPGESWAIEAHCGYWPLVKRICVVYLQIAKLCLSVSIRLGKKEEERVGVPVAETKAEVPKPSAEEIKAARSAASDGEWCPGPAVLCKGNDGACPGFCHTGDSAQRRRAARTWLAERGISLKEPETNEHPGRDASYDADEEANFGR